MSLLSTLAKVAVGVAVAKGVSGMAGGQQRGTTSSRGAGTGSVFGDLLSGMGGGGGAGGGLGQVLSGRGNSSGGLGGLLESLSQSSRPAGDIQAQAPQGGSLGDLLNQSLDSFGEPDTAPSADQEDAAKVMLRAMLQAAKSDGRIDADEKKKLLGQIGDISPDEMEFINQELERPVDVEGLIRDVPRGMGAQVYTMSLMAIDLDSKNEAKYLHQLATGLNISPTEANAIHTRMGEPTIYS